MENLKETVRILLMLIFLFIFMYAIGGLNFTVAQYEAAEPSLPSTVTVYSRSVSLLSSKENVRYALGDSFFDLADYSYITPKLFLYRENNKFYTYFLDPYGEIPDKCSIYNGLTSASTVDEIEAAFGTDCLKAENRYAEIFIDDKEADYEKTSCPEKFYNYDLYCHDFNPYWFCYDIAPLEEVEAWFESTAQNYPDAEYITLLTYSYYDEDEPNKIIFYVYTTNESMKGIML